MIRLMLGLFLVGVISTPVMADLPVNVQPIESEEELQSWLVNMVWKHKFTNEEVAAATGLSGDAVDAAMKKYDIRLNNSPEYTPTDRVVVLPHTGGRFAYPSGFSSSQQSIMVSVFTPWQPEDRSEASYLIVELDQIIFNSGLITETVAPAKSTFPSKKMASPRKVWKELPQGELQISQYLFETGDERITAQVSIKPHQKHVILEVEFKNETPGTLTLSSPSPIDTRWIHDIKKISKHDIVRQAPYRAIPDVTGNRWIITAWNWNDRMSACGSGKTQTVRGLISFYEGNEVRQELERLDASKWAEPTESK